MVAAYNDHLNDLCTIVEMSEFYFGTKRYLEKEGEKRREGKEGGECITTYSVRTVPKSATVEIMIVALYLIRIGEGIPPLRQLVEVQMKVYKLI